MGETENSVSHDHSPEEENNVIINFVKEKGNLQEELVKRDKEIQSYKAKVYDLYEKIKTLEEELKTAKENLKSRKLPLDNSSSQGPSTKLGVVRPSTARTRSPMVQRAKSAKNRGAAPKQAAAPATPKKVDSPVPPPVASEPTSSEDSQKLIKATNRLDQYERIAEKYPDLKLSVIFKSEKLFKEGDSNNDGTIDQKELEKMLMKQGHLYTDKELKDIMSLVDVDDTGTIDIMEYLAVMERIQQRKRTKLPDEITRSSACRVQ